MKKPREFMIDDRDNGDGYVVHEHKPLHIQGECIHVREVMPGEERLEIKLRIATEALEYIAGKAHWYATVHQGPENEVHHALKVEINHEANEALEKIRAK